MATNLSPFNPSSHVLGFLCKILKDKSQRDDRWQWEGLQDLFVCWELGWWWWCAILGTAAENCKMFHTRHDWSLKIDTFRCFICRTFKRASWYRSGAVVCFTVRKGSVCIAQYYASLLPPTLQRAKASNAFASFNSDLAIHRGLMGLTSLVIFVTVIIIIIIIVLLPPSTTSITTTYLSALATGSIATGDGERGGGGGVCLNMCVHLCRREAHFPNCSK